MHAGVSIRTIGRALISVISELYDRVDIVMLYAVLTRARTVPDVPHDDGGLRNSFFPALFHVLKTAYDAGHPLLLIAVATAQILPRVNRFVVKSAKDGQYVFVF